MKINMVQSSGLLMYRIKDSQLQFFLIHPGGPFYAKKDLGTWSIPKGIAEKDEDLLEAAKREFFEETGIRSNAPYLELGSVDMKSKKKVFAWAFMHDPGEITIKSNKFSMEWPPKSGKFQEFPETDQGAFFEYDEALLKIIPDQVPFLDRLRFCN